MPYTPSSSALLDLLAALIDSDAERAPDGRPAALHRWKAKAMESADAMIPMHAAPEKAAEDPQFQQRLDDMREQMIEARRREVETWFQQTFGLPPSDFERQGRH